MVEKHRGALSSYVDKNGALRKRKSRSESENDFSDINDAEISGYLNNKTEMLFKKLIWESMNKGYPGKQRKHATRKKPASVTKAVASKTEKAKEEQNENKKRLSSKINYDALEKQTDQYDEVTEKAKTGGIDSNCRNQIETQQSEGTPSLEGYGSEEDNYSVDFEPENANLYSYGTDEEYEFDEF